MYTIILQFQNSECLLLAIERGYMRIKECLIWLTYEKVREVQSFIGRLLKIVTAIWC